MTISSSKKEKKTTRASSASAGDGESAAVRDDAAGTSTSTGLGYEEEEGASTSLSSGGLVSRRRTLFHVGTAGSGEGTGGGGKAPLRRQRSGGSSGGKAPALRRQRTPTKTKTRQRKIRSFEMENDNSRDVALSARISFEIAVKSNQEAINKKVEAAAAVEEEEDIQKRKKKASPETTTKGLVASRRQTLFHVGTTNNNDAQTESKTPRRSSSGSNRHKRNSEGSSGGGGRKSTSSHRRTSVLVSDRQAQLTRQLNTSLSFSAVDLPTDGGKRMRPASSFSSINEASSDNNETAGGGGGGGKASSTKTKHKIKRQKSGEEASFNWQKRGDKEAEASFNWQKRASETYATTTENTTITGAEAGFNWKKRASDITTTITTTNKTIIGGEEAGFNWTKRGPGGSSGGSSSTRQRRNTVAASLSNNIFLQQKGEDLKEKQSQEQRPNKRLSLEETGGGGGLVSTRKSLLFSSTTSMANSLYGGLFQSTKSKEDALLSSFQPLDNKRKALQKSFSSSSFNYEKGENNKKAGSSDKDLSKIEPIDNKRKALQKSFSSTSLKGNKSTTTPKKIPPSIILLMDNSNSSTSEDYEEDEGNKISPQTAALRIQQFLKSSSGILKCFREEEKFWHQEMVDTERRRKEELQYVAEWLELEKRTYQLQLPLQLQLEEEEQPQGSSSSSTTSNNNTPTKSILDGMEELKQDAFHEKLGYYKLRNDITRLKQENQKLLKSTSTTTKPKSWVEQQKEEEETEQQQNLLLEKVQFEIQELQQRHTFLDTKILYHQKHKQKVIDTIAKIRSMMSTVVVIGDPPPPVPTTTTKKTLSALVEEPTGNAEDFTSGRKDQNFDDVYEMGKLLGEGAFGEVRVCSRKAGGDGHKDRAVKIIQKSWMSQWELDDVLKEFELLTQVKNNPNVIRVYEFYDTDDTFFMVQELASGGELFDELERRGGKLPELEVAKLMKNILGCAKYLAEQRLVHRDLNLENILLQEPGNYGTIKLIDFGLAAKCEAGQKLFEFVGKPRYVAPEVLGDDGYDMGYDVWSCGIVAATLLTGFFPFEGKHDMEVYQQISDGAYINYNHKDWDGISDQAKSFVQQLLAFKEEDRPTAAQALNHPWIDGNTDDTPPQAEIWVAPTQETVSDSTDEKDRPARVIQNFLRESASILAWYREETSYWEEEKQDIARRRQEELEATEKYLEIEKQQIHMEVSQDTDSPAEGSTDLSLQRETIKTLKEELIQMRDEHNKLIESIRKLTHDNKQLSRDHKMDDKIKELERRIKMLMAYQGKDKEKLFIIKMALELLKQQNAMAQEKKRRDLAARKIQHFLSESTAILQWYRDDLDYWQEEKKDIERRRQEELGYTNDFIDVEKKQFQLQMHHEFGSSESNPDDTSKDGGQSLLQYQELEEANNQLLKQKEENNILTESIRDLSRENKRLARGGPVSSHATKHLESKIAALKTQHAQQEVILGVQKEAETELTQQIEAIQGKRDKHHGKVTQLENCIARIMGLVELYSESTNDPGLANAIRKLKKGLDSKEPQQSRVSFGIVDEKKEDSNAKRRTTEKSQKKQRPAFSWKKHALKRQKSAPDLRRAEDGSDSDSDEDTLKANTNTNSSENSRIDPFRHSDIGPASFTTALASNMLDQKDTSKPEKRKSKKVGRRNTMQRMESTPTLWKPLPDSKQDALLEGKKSRNKSIKHSSNSIDDGGRKKGNRRISKSNSTRDFSIDDGGRKKGNRKISKSNSTRDFSRSLNGDSNEGMLFSPLMSLIADTSSSHGKSRKKNRMDKKSHSEHFSRTLDSSDRGDEESNSKARSGSERRERSISSRRSTDKGVDASDDSAKKKKGGAYSWRGHMKRMDSAPLLLDASSHSDSDDDTGLEGSKTDRRQSMQRGVSTPSLGGKGKTTSRNSKGKTRKKK